MTRSGMSFVRTTDSHVLVIGSANVDVSVGTAVLPRPGETVIGNTSFITVGGKGANQAAAAAACAVGTHFVGRVGADAFGHMITEGLRSRHVRVEELRAISDIATGVATISVEDSGKNCIIVVPGANACLKAADLDELAPLLESAAVVVLQCEIPMDTVYRAIELSAKSSRPVILNPAPFRGLDLGRIAGDVTYLIPNETEASMISGRPIDTVDQAKECGVWLHAQGIECVIITLGAQGCVAVDEKSARHFAGHRVAAIDTTGAGDAFVGCLAAALATGRPRDESIGRALLYSALSTTRRGAQVSYPELEEFERALSAPTGQ
jgi:ribokinase